jgi:regulator of CtrA degradation
MLGALSNSPFQSKLIDGLYVDAMTLAEAARGYFDGVGRQERETLDPVARVAFSCESLKVTTRLMHVIAWVLTQRAVEAGEMRWTDARDPVRRLGCSPESNEDLVAGLPPRARTLTRASLDLHRRTERLDLLADEHVPVGSPVQMLQARLDLAF